ncbi:hypothetical protein DRQ25_10490 [Candidatus Fermentibacteria bacterium]|nr:MAG: hypothetical protein DRQ25_10490 [Candidatus Fermentibacteria bacterium]
MKSIGTSFYAAAVISIFIFPCIAEANVPPQRIPQLDSLALDISLMGYIPSGGELLVLAASNNWFGLLSCVKLLPGDTYELDSILTDTTGKWRYLGYAFWAPAGDIILVAAPAPKCLPRDMEPTVQVGSRAAFYFDGYELLTEPRTAVSTPHLEIIEINPDSTGRFAFSTPLKGVYWVEVMQQTPLGPSIELLFPVISGGTAEDVFMGTITIPASEADSPSGILHELNAIRQSKGIPTLEASEILDSLASIRAGNLAFSASLSHFGLNTGNLPDILPESVSIYGENIGRGKGYQEAWSMILISPFHLQTCMSETYTHAGISGAVDTEEYEWQLVLVQIFASGVDEE